jgi:hypothetical protein
MNSQILKPELANRTINVRFANLEVKDAVQKIFEGQPLNYLYIEGKGIRVTDAATSGGTSSTGSTSIATSFPDSPQQAINPQPLNNLQPQANPAVQPAPQQGPFGNPPAATPAQPVNTNPGGAIVPGQLPPAIGAGNPLVGPSSPAPAATGGAAAPVGFPTAPPPVPAQPQGPGNVGATPGVIK